MTDQEEHTIEDEELELLRGTVYYSILMGLEFLDKADDLSAYDRLRGKNRVLKLIVLGQKIGCDLDDVIEKHMSTLKATHEPTSGVH